MSKFKVGDRVKITTGSFCGNKATVVRITYGVYLFNVVLEDNPDNVPELAYSEYELELIPEQKPKTKTVRKYACVYKKDDGSVDTVVDFHSEKFLKECEDLYFKGEKIYHIIPTIFEDVEVPIETETRWTFICKNYKGEYYPTASKYNSLDQAKSCTLNEAIQKIEDSAEEFEIE